MDRSKAPKKKRRKGMAAAAAAKLPRAYEEQEHVPAAVEPAHFISLDYAEPSPIMVGFQKGWRTLKRTLKIGAVVALVGLYPAAMVITSHINDKPVFIPTEQSWAVPGIAVAIHKIARELEGAGWAANRPVWHPQARLTALPAWQAGTADALSQHVKLISELSPWEGAPDNDLAAAARLLTEVPGESMRPRLTAAAEALNRFDTRASRGLAMRPMPEEIMPEELALFASWAAEDRAALSDRINAVQEGGWPASKDDITAFYRAKARAHVAHEMFVANRDKAYTLSDTAILVAADRVDAAWERAAEMKPVFVSNQSDSAMLMPNHLASMAYFLLEAEEASRHLASLMEPAAEEEIIEETSVAQADAEAATARP